MVLAWKPADGRMIKKNFAFIFTLVNVFEPCESIIHLKIKQMLRYSNYFLEGVHLIPLQYLIPSIQKHDLVPSLAGQKSLESLTNKVTVSNHHFLQFVENTEIISYNGVKILKYFPI